MSRSYAIFAKRMRRVSSLSIETGDPVYYYITVDPTDDLSMLLANKRRRRVTDYLMSLEVQRNMAHVMDTGIRINPMLAQMHGYHDGINRSTNRGMCVPTDSDFETQVPLSDEDAVRRNLVLVAVV